MVTTKLNLSMTEPSVRQIYAKQGDTGRVLDISLDQTPEDGTLRILRPDGVEVTSEAVTGGEVESGETVTFESMTEADVTELTVGIEPVQDLNGYDKPWVGGAGKNKVDNSAIEVGYYTESGQHSLSTDYRTSALTPAKPNTAYSTSIFAKNTKERVGGLVATCWDANESIIGQYTTSSFTTPANTAYVRVRNFQAAISYVTSDNFLYQLEEGSTATAWQPYSNICPITGHDEVTVTDEGTNLLNYDAWKTVSITRGTAVWENNGVTLTATSTDCFTDWSNAAFPQGARVSVTEGETITLAWDATPTWLGSAYIFPNGQTSGLVTAHSDVGHLSYTVASGVTYLTFRFGVSSSGVTESYKNIQIVRGTTVPTWTPYVAPHTYTTSLGQTVYGGTLDMVTGVLNVTYGYKDIDDFATLTSWTSAGGLYIAEIAGTYTANAPSVCSMLEQKTVNQAWTSTTECYAIEGSKIRVYTTETTLANFKTKFAQLQIAYSLAEPVTYQLTTQQIKTLIGTNNVWASSGDIVSIKFAYGGLFSELPSDATSIVGKCYCDVEQNGVSSMPFTLNVKKNERES